MYKVLQYTFEGQKAEGAIDQHFLSYLLVINAVMHALHHCLQYQQTISVTGVVYAFMQYAVPWSWMILCLLSAMTVYVITATE